jgi:sortase A
VNRSLTLRPSEETYFIKPGLHSHNRRRRLDPHPLRHRIVGVVRGLLFFGGLCGIAYYGYALLNEYVYQTYENWAFDQKIAGRQVTFADYVRERTPFGFLTGERTSTPRVVTRESPAPSEVQPSTLTRPVEGSVLGRVQIGRLNLSAIVREGVNDATLSRAVGHLPYTALPGQTGNFALAAHRDTLFRALKDIQKDDRVTFQSQTGTYTYQVVSTNIVKPSDLRVVQPQGSEKLLTMITCYPFYYVGSAPKRFIVQARLLDTNLASESAVGGQTTRSQNTGPPPSGVAGNPIKRPAAQPKLGKRTREPRRMRGSSVSSASRSSHASDAANKSQTHRKKLGLWHKLFHRNHSE